MYTFDANFDGAFSITKLCYSLTVLKSIFFNKLYLFFFFFYQIKAIIYRENISH